MKAKVNPARMGAITMNRLYINMVNKVKVIDGAIEMCRQLKRGETITLRGLHTYRISLQSSGWSMDDMDRRISELYAEKADLQIRIARFNIN